MGKPLIAVNHLEGHVRAVFLEAYRAGGNRSLPAVCLIVSGGHTVLYRVTAAGGPEPASAKVFYYRRIGQTRDDAAGEAYDKVAKLLASAIRAARSSTGLHPSPSGWHMRIAATFASAPAG